MLTFREPAGLTTATFAGRFRSSTAFFGPTGTALSSEIAKSDGLQSAVDDDVRRRRRLTVARDTRDLVSSVLGVAGGERFSDEASPEVVVLIMQQPTHSSRNLMVSD